MFDTLLIQENVVDRHAMATFASIAKAMGLDVLCFESRDGEQFIGEEKLILDKHKAYLPFTSVRTFDFLRRHDNIIGYSLREYNTEDFISIFGHENMLNPSPNIVDVESINWTGEELFIRPYTTDKVFKGGLYVSPSKELKGLCAVSPYVDISHEYRFFIQKGTIIAKSMYIRDKALCLSSMVTSDIIDFTEKQIKKFTNVDNYVIDIARTNKGLKIIELNCFNTSGFYNIDFYKFISSLK